MSVVGEEASRFLGHSELEGLADEVGLRVPPRLGRGTRAELTRLPVRYPSRVSGELGLPELSGNVAEGFVLKPDVELSAAGRPVVKHKIPEFDDNRFDDSRPFDADAHLSVEELLELAKAMMGPMRVASARSKVGVSHVAYGDVEHFRPKAAFRSSSEAPEHKPGYYWLAYEWSNLYFACEQCNRRHKRNRPSLCERRRGRRALLLTLLRNIRAWLSFGCPEAQRSLTSSNVAQVLECIRDDAEYASMARCLVREAIPWCELVPSMVPTELLEQFEEDALAGRWFVIPPS